MLYLCRCSCFTHVQQACEIQSLYKQNCVSNLDLLPSIFVSTPYIDWYLLILLSWSLNIMWYHSQDSESEKLVPGVFSIQLILFRLPLSPKSEPLPSIYLLTSFPHTLLQLYLNRIYASVGRLQLVQAIPDLLQQQYVQEVAFINFDHLWSHALAF